MINIFVLFKKFMNFVSTDAVILLVPYRLAGGTLSLLAVRLSVCLPVCPSHFSFPDFSLSSFEILTLNLVYEFVMTKYRSGLSLVTLDKFLRELLPFAKIQFPRFFSVTFWDIDLKFGIWICHNIIQIKFEFCHA